MGRDIITVGDWLNEIFKTLDGGTNTRRIQAGSSVSGSSHDYDPFRQNPYSKLTGFPPLNVEINKETKDFKVSFALAGISKDRIKVSFDDGSLVLEIADIENKENPWQTIQQGIKQSVSGTKRYQFPTNKYDVDKAEASWNDGILSIVVPLKTERQPKEIKIK